MSADFTDAEDIQCIFVTPRSVHSLCFLCDMINAFFIHPEKLVKINIDKRFCNLYIYESVSVTVLLYSRVIKYLTEN